jgi:hypothetical protein
MVKIKKKEDMSSFTYTFFKKKLNYRQKMVENFKRKNGFKV